MIDKLQAGRAALGALALTLCLGAFTAPALAGPPNHTRTPTLDLTGGLSDPGATHPAKPFDQACGTAVDDKGDVYVSSAGNDAIDVFNAAHEYLTTIANANDPCGLAVDSKGQLYVSEKATGKVVRYMPNAYPFAGKPTYGAPTTIDSSGEAEGISVDPFDDRLYVAKGDRIDAYNPDGSLGIDEVQRINCFECSGGTYKLSFGGSEPTAAINFEGPAAEVKTALEALSTIGSGDVLVAGDGKTHFVTFMGELAGIDVELLVGDSSNLIGSPSKAISVVETTNGFNGHIAEGEFTNATGVAPYTYKINKETATRYLYAADSATDEVKVLSGTDIRTLKLRRTIGGVDHDHDPETPEQELGFGTAGAHLAADRGNKAADGKCAKVAGQACTAGHFLVYDDANEAVEEFDATGEFLDRIESEGLEDAEPSGLAIERSGTASDGTIYVTSGKGAGAKLVAFGPLVVPDRAAVPGLSRVLTEARAVAVDSHGNVYVIASPSIHVYDPSGKALTEFQDADAIDLAVDSEGNVYVLDASNIDQEEVNYYAPEGGEYPPKAGTKYVRHEPAAIAAEGMEGIAVNPADDHLFVLGSGTAPFRITEFGAAAEGSPAEGDCGAGLALPGQAKVSIDVHGASGDVYLSANGGHVAVVDCDAKEILREFRGGGCPSGEFGFNPAIAVDQSNGHLLEFQSGQPGNTAREYDAAGACVAEFGSFAGVGDGGIAIDNSGGPNDGTVYVAYDSNDNAKQPFDLNAFAPLSYGEAPLAVTGVADGIEAGGATLNATVNPRGFELSSCEFEYLTDAQFLSNGKSFAGAVSVSCAETPAQIGKGTSPVPVQAAIGGLDPDARYRFRVAAENKYGESIGKAGLFGPPLLSTETALPVLYDEATLRAQVDPSGLATKYRFEYGTSIAYDQSTPEAELPPGEGPVAIEAPLTGLDEGTTYHFRIVVENEAKQVEGPDQTLLTLQRAKEQTCPNTQYRTGFSSSLPDCRAYELVTPADTGGQEPNALPSAGTVFNNWLVDPRGEGAGESVAFFAGTLSGFDGSGDNDGYRAQRGEGEHPPQGWRTEFYGPTYAQLGGGSGNNQEGVAADQRYWVWHSPAEVFPALLPVGFYLRTPEGIASPDCNINGEDFQDEFELIGCGSLGTDPTARSRFVSAGGNHLLFSSEAHLEDEAAPAGTMAIYDRKAGEASAEVISVKPDGSPFGPGEAATYVGSSEDGAAALFKVDEDLYLHREGITTHLAEPPYTFAGISEDGARVFYVDATFTGDATPPAGLFVCDTEAGPCLGAEPTGLTEIATDSVLLSVSPGGTDALFTSEDALTGPEENENEETAQAGAPNLYSWDGTATRFLAVLDPEDFVGFGDPIIGKIVNLSRWIRSIDPASAARANSPTRATPDGDAFLFQSHAQLTSYDNEGHGEIYRYEPAGPEGERLLCVSCDPSGAPPSADAMLQIYTGKDRGHTDPTTLIANITDDGQAVFFHSPDRLLPEDANAVTDVYEWRANGSGNCDRPGGCLALISSGQGEEASTLYGMSADGSDVFFSTPEKLVGADIPSSSSIYDARVNGGIPDPPTEAPCQGDACQGQGTPPPSLPAPASAAGTGEDKVQQGKPSPRCPKGKRKVRSKGKVRCVKKPNRHRRQSR